ncbi:DDE-type integrase/transposase/recombinase [Halanaerobium hydrogeniformans]|uniref:DDE-type integrase/transposase/recombinase n=1 Tax=Halanaerobium hydrogeniformans TaxID=656519 RepID=UPI00031FE813
MRIHPCYYRYLTKKIAPLFKLKSEKIIPDNLNHSDEWHVDKTIVKIKGQKYYLWVIIDSETRFVLSYNLFALSKYCSSF